jgi:hypothetical protein
MKSIYFHRLFSKLFDYTFCFLVLALIAFLTPFSIDNLLLYLLAATPILWILPEALLLSTWGTTPGYAIFSIAPKTFEGYKLPFKQALRFALFLRKVLWVRCEKNISNVIIRLGIVCFLLLGGLFAKAVIDFPQEFGKEVTIRGWVHFTSSEGDFTAEFPSRPSTQQKQLEIPQAKRTLDYQEVSTNHSHESTYSVSALELPKKWMIFSSNTILKGALSVLIDNMSFGTKLLDKQFTKHGPHPAIDYHINEQGKVSKGRLVLVGQKLFKVEFSAPEEALTEDAAIKFIQSFQPLSQ